jgi:hypothetical protein
VRTSLSIAAAGVVIGMSLTACGNSGSSSSASEVSPGIPTANVIANQLNNSGLSCEGPIETSGTGASEGLDCGGGLKIQTFANVADRDKAYAAAAAGSGVAVFIGSTLVQTPNAATAKQAAAITGGTLPPPKPTPTPSATPKVTVKPKVTTKPARPAVKVAPKVAASPKVSKVAAPRVATVPVAKASAKASAAKSPVVAKAK